MAGAVRQGALALFGAGLVSRILGFFYRIFLSRFLGAQGMGLLGMAFPILGLAITVASAGLPVALAKIVAERRATGRRAPVEALRVSLFLALGVSLPLTILLYRTAPFISRRILPDPRSLRPLVALLPLLPVVATASVLRGYLQGLQRMGSLGIAQIAEQVVRIGAALYLVRTLAPRGLVFAVVGAGTGIVAGELFGLAVLLLSLRKHLPFRPPIRAAGWSDSWSTLEEILGLAVPVTLTRLLGAATDLLDATLIPRGLMAYGLLRTAATSFYGRLTGMAFPLVLFPSVVSGALSGALIPAISEAAARGDLELVSARSEKALGITLFYSLPFSAALITLGGPLARHIYGVPGVAVLIPPLALAAPLLYLEFTLSSILRGLGRPLDAMRNGLVGSAVRLAMIYTLTPRPGFGPRAILLAILVDLIICLNLNLRSLRRLVPLRLDLRRHLAFPLAGALLLGILQLQAYPFLTSLWSSAPALLVSLLAGGGAYLLFLFGTGSLPRGLTSV